MILRLVRGSTNCPAGSKKSMDAQFHLFLCSRGRVYSFFYSTRAAGGPKYFNFATLHRGKNGFCIKHPLHQVIVFVGHVLAVEF